MQRTQITSLDDVEYVRVHLPHETGQVEESGLTS